MKTKLFSALAIAILVCSCAGKKSSEGTFTVMTYNIGSLSKYEGCSAEGIASVIKAEMSSTVAIQGIIQISSKTSLRLLADGIFPSQSLLTIKAEPMATGLFQASRLLLVTGLNFLVSRALKSEVLRWLKPRIWYSQLLILSIPPMPSAAPRQR